MDDHDWVAEFTKTFEQPDSQVEAQIWAEVLGDEYPAELAPYSYTTRTELARFADALRVGPADDLLDIGCGRGGPGLWMAATTGARYTAVDVAASALEAVRAHAERIGIGNRVVTIEGRFESLPLEAASVDAIMTIDALLFALNKSQAAREMARVLRPGGRLVATTWDYHTQPTGRPPQVEDHRPLLDEAGFDVETYDETSEWDRRQRAINALLLERVDDLAAESGEDPAAVRVGVEEMVATQETMSRRVLVIATRRPESGQAP
jgi:SAM-dependent methyltransferase